MKSILDIMFIPKCIGCGNILNTENSKVLCADCNLKYESETKRECPVCKLKADMCRCVPSKLHDTDKIQNIQILKTAFYFPSENTVSKKLIYTLKKKKLKYIETFFAESLAKNLKALFESSGIDISCYNITYPPRSKENIIKYGFDHCKILAKLVAKYTGAEFVSAFKNNDRAEQKTLSREERLENTKNVFKPRGTIIQGKHFIILDDVITTGSTISSAAKTLKENGALSVFPAAIMMNAPKKLNDKSNYKIEPSTKPWFLD